MAKFYTKTGWLTDYALACGYIHKTEKPDETVILERRDCGDYGVTHWKRGASGRVGNGGLLRDGIEGWEVFSSLQAARKFYTARAGVAWRFEAGVSRNVRV